MALRAIFTTILLTMLLVGGVATYYAALPEDIGLQSFRSRAAFQTYLEALQSGQFGRGPGWLSLAEFGDTTTAGAEEGGFSGTNVQVAGVDEADLVKSDGEFLYLATGQEVVVVRAHPVSEMAVVSRISGEDLVGDTNATHMIVGLFLFEKTLVVLTSLYPTFQPTREASVETLAVPSSGGATLVSLFSVLAPESPSLSHELELTGEYRASRMKGGTVYVVLHQYLWVGEKDVAYPVICEDGHCEEFDATRIFYDPDSLDSGSLTNVVAIDVSSGETGYLSVLTGYASTVYMSPSNLYVTFAKVSHGPSTLSLGGDAWESVTSIYRIPVEGTKLSPAAGGDVRGWLLNQFSLDEHRDHLRVATTTWEERSENNVYVLDEAMEVVGALEGLAPGETIYSARFVDDMGYLVTFQKVDPFFVLDLSDPRRPLVLGYLKIPGFSEYLHPMDETHILGVGKDAVEDPSGQFAWFQGLKLSLFDVSDVGNPREVAQLFIGDRGSSSPVLYDHRAFLYIREAGLVVLPVSVVDLAGRTDNGEEVPPWEYGTEGWQGALVVSVTPERGFEVLSRITHVPPEEVSCGYRYGPHAVSRSLYIGEYLYTISPTVLKAHSLTDFAEAASLIYDNATGPWTC